MSHDSIELKRRRSQNDFWELWNAKKVDIIPVIVWATGIVKSNLMTYLNITPGNPVFLEIYESEVQGTESILKRLEKGTTALLNCESIFSQKHHLKDYLLIHFEKKAFHCPDCEFKFYKRVVWRHSLLSHSQIIYWNYKHTNQI